MAEQAYFAAALFTMLLLGVLAGFMVALAYLSDDFNPPNNGPWLT